MKAAAIAAGIALAIFAAAVVGVNLWLKNYLRSPEFTGLVESSAGSALGAEARFDKIGWNGSSAFSGSTEFHGHPTSVLKSLDATGVRADLDWRAVFSGIWRVERIAAAGLRAEFQVPAGDNTPAARPPSARALPSFLPSKFELGEIASPSAELSFGEWRVVGTALTARPEGSNWKFEGRGGSLRGPGIPGYPIDSFSARTNRGVLFLNPSRLKIGERGKAIITGESGPEGSLEIECSDVNSADVLPAKWKAYLDGTLEGKAKFSSEKTFSGSARLTDGHAIRIPALEALADYTKNPTFRNLPINEMRGNFSGSNGTRKISAFSAESKGLLKIEGAATIGENGSLSGDIRAGITAGTLRWLPGAQDRVFADGHDGYYWAPIKLGGTIDAPTEDLSPRLARAAGAAVIETGTNLIKETPAKAVDTAVEGAKSLLDMFLQKAP